MSDATDAAKSESAAYALGIKLGLSPADAQAYAASVAAGQSDSNDPDLFWKWDAVPNQRQSEHSGGMTNNPVIVKASEAMDDFENWPSNKLNNFIDEAIKAGLLKEGDGYFAAKDLWVQLVKTSVDKTHAGVNMNPFDVLSMLGGNGKSAQSSRPKTTVSTNKTVNFTNPDDARAFINQSLSNLLGRRANPGEVDDFISSLHGYEAANPTTSTTTTNHKYDAAGNEIKTNNSTVSQGGATDAGRNQLIEDDTMQTPEYASVQAASTYFPLLQQALGPAANVQGR